MSITYQENNKIFHLTTKNSDYQIQIDPFGYLLHLYYGKKTSHDAVGITTFYDRGFSGNPGDVIGDRTYSMDTLPQEFPMDGTGDYRNIALSLEDCKGTQACDFRYLSHSIKKGKYTLNGLPYVYAREEQAETLEILLKDDVLGMELTLLYGVIPEINCITRSAILENKSSEIVTVDKAAAACLDFLTGDFDVITFHGRHTMERNVDRSPVGYYATSVGSRRGTSSHQYNPLMILADQKTTEEYGKCYSMSFVYSGGFEASVEKDQFNQTRMLMGLQSSNLRYRIKPGKQWIIPEVILSHSENGLTQLSHQLHDCINNHIIRGKYQKGPRPILINSWEANYFDINADNLIGLAKEASELGIDMLVMDDGWFGKRNNDDAGLGDWTVNEDKLGMSLSEMIDKINALGMKFGIWFEPEMINEDSDLYRAHPDYAMTIPGRKPGHARDQLLLDFSREEVVENIYQQMKDILDHNHIEYVKWDFNRSISDVFSHSDRIAGEVLYDYMIGLYGLLERLCQDYPDILIEGCSGGGGRFDAGMMYYTPQIWCSDNTDAINRTLIQYGTSFGYPISTVGSHVSAVPNHQTGRITSLKTRATVAMSGTFGYELDLSKLSQEEKDTIKEQVAEYKKYAALIAEGRYYRLSDPKEEHVCAWSFVSANQEECLMNTIQLQIESNMKVFYVKFRGLAEHSYYKDEKTGSIYSSDILMEIGLPLKLLFEEYHSEQLYLKKVEA
ncbi:MAG: alpha-galactosidase [Eubacteriales bacterium]|nr:alpha-galactosidase [Eubacteriales bacterium]